MKKNLNLLVALLIIGCTGSPEPPIELGGPWFFLADSNQVGISDAWFAQDDDFTRGDIISPGKNWENLLNFDYDGVGWYFCEFSYPPRTQQIALVLRTFDDSVKIWLNGQVVGAGPELMKIELTPFILQGKNRLAIQVTDLAGPGGLQHPVKLVAFRNPREFEAIQ